MLYKDRKDAALKLIPLLEKYKKEDCIVLAVPRGGVPIGYYIANQYDFPLELLLTKKIGHPLNSEVAIGAVSLEDSIVDYYPNIPQKYIDTEIQRLRKFLKEKHKKFMGDRKTINLKGKTAIIVDDGIATGNTLLLAIQMIRKKNPNKIVVVVPVAPEDVAKRISKEVEELICPLITNDFNGVGSFYADFSEVTDEEVINYWNRISTPRNKVNSSSTASLKNINHPTLDTVDLRKLITNNSILLKNEKSLLELVDKIGDAKYVLLGEASHGTHEYYTWRTQISKMLIEKKGFSFIAVEGDWPDCYRLNRYIKNYEDSGKTAYEVLHSFSRWPTWMWANWETVALAEWLREHNDKMLDTSNKIGFYGLDVYSLWESFDSIIQYLDRKDPVTKKTAINALNCFEPYKEGEGSQYAKASRMVPDLCENEVVDLLSKIRRNMPIYNTDKEAVLNVGQNAQVIVNAERYYRTMINAGPDSWNIRDLHMVQTLDTLMDFHGPNSKGIIWEHNTHIGDARATDMAKEGIINVGQVVRQNNKEEDVYTIGFGSYQGNVTAGRSWNDVMQTMKVPEAVKGSWEYELHQLNAKDRVIFMTDEMKQKLGKKYFGHRAIGVVYRPKYEFFGNYVPSIMPNRYDAFMYLDTTSALHPLHIKPDGHQLSETYPFGV